jgi:Gas vesicle synthesis protein GvpL/GvpF/Lsr2
MSHGCQRGSLVCAEFAGVILQGFSRSSIEFGTGPVGVRVMATRTQVMLTCDVCGNAKDVQTRIFGLDGKTYEIDLCPKDSKGLSRATGGYLAKARKVTARQRPRHNGRRPRSRAESRAIRDGGRAPGKKKSGRGRVTGSTQEEAKTSRSGQQAARASGATPKAKANASKQQATKADRPRPQRAKADGSKQAAEATGRQQEKGIYVYGILPADIEMTAEMAGVGKHPGLLRVVCSDGLAALISEVDLSGQLRSSDDLKTHREILDATATEVPVLPLHFGTVLASEHEVAEELLAAHHDEFADALEQLEGHAEFLVRGTYVERAVLDQVLSDNRQAAWLQDQIQGKDPGAAQDARIKLGGILNEAVTARREQDTRALEQAMEGVSVASAVKEPAHELDAIHVAFLVAADQESDVERVIEDLARDWEGRIEVQLLGPMAAYDFAGTLSASE